MSAATEERSGTVSAWSGCVHAGNGHPRSNQSSTATGVRWELGPAVFEVPESPSAPPVSRVHAGGVFCVLSGYLYNWRELAAELGEPAGERKESLEFPAELLIRGYRRWSSDLLQHLDGFFALALWDEPRRTLLCGRDPTGQHPFFYSDTAEGLVFSWDVDAVRRHPAVPRGINRVVLAEHLAHRWIDVEETFFEGIRRLPGAHGLKYSNGSLTVFRYWDPIPAGEAVRWVTPEELREFPAVLRQSVERTMECGRTGIFLSGGFDSISVATWAAQISRERRWPAPRALCANFPGDDSERAVQQHVARALGFESDFEEVAAMLARKSILSSYVERLASFPSPPINGYSAIYDSLLHTAKSRGCGVVLTGEGGDEWLAVTPVYAADLIRRGDLAGLVRLIRAGTRSYQLSLTQLVRNIVWSNGIRLNLRNWVWTRFPSFALRRRRRLIPQAMPAWLAPDPALHGLLVERFMERWRRRTRDGSHYFTSLREDFDQSLVHIAFEERFYRDMLAGVPTLHPYWSRSVVEFLVRTPPDALNQGGRSKALIRKAMDERFPQLCLEKQKKQMSPDFARTLFRQECPGLWSGAKPVATLAALGIVEPGKLQETADAAIKSGERVRLHLLWHAGSSEVWSRLHQ